VLCPPWTRAALFAIALSSLLWLPMPAAADPTPGARAVCAVGSKLIADGLPQRALKVALIGSTLDDPCVARMEARARATIARAASDAAQAANEKEPAKAKALDDDALALDSENEAATALRAKLDETTFTTAWKGDWNRFLDGTVKPLKDVLLPFACVLVVLLGIARLVAASPFDWARTSRSNRRALWIAGLALAAGSSLLLTTGLSERHRWDAHLWALPAVLTPFEGALAAVAGILILACAMTTRLRLSIAVQDKTGTASPSGVGHVTALLGELGGAPPRGLEIPHAADVTGLDAASLAGIPAGKVVAAFVKFWQLVFATAPWSLEVDEVNADVIAVVLTRNGRTVRSAVVARRPLGLTSPIVPDGAPDGDPAADGDDKAPNVPDLHRFAAAVVLTALAEEYEDFPELRGVSDWRSLGLHYVATADYASDANKDQSSAALVQALEYDEENLPALVALRNNQERDSDELEVLDRYVEWLGTVATSLDDKPEARALRLRLRMTLVAVACNRQAQGRRLASLQQSRRQADRLIEDLTDATGPTRTLVESMRPGAAAAFFSLGAVDQAATAKTFLARPSRFGPESNYRYGCLYARPPIRSARALSPEPPDEDIAIEHLRLAAVSPTLKARMAGDPWLEGLRRSRKWRAEPFVQEKPDFLALAPLSAYADQLRAAGFGTATALAGASERRIAGYLGVNSLVAERLIGLAEFACGMPAGLADYRTEIVDACLEQGIDSTLRLVEAREANGTGELTRAFLKSIRRQWREVPAEARLTAWIRDSR
jgi:hypothetical protein